MESSSARRVNLRFLRKMRKALGTLPDAGTQEDIERKAFLRYVPAAARRRLEMKGSKQAMDDEALGLFKKLGVKEPQEGVEQSARSLLDLAAMPTQEFAKMADEDMRVQALDDASVRKSLGITLAEQGPLKFLSAEAVTGAHLETEIPQEFLSIPTQWKDSALPGIHKEYWLQNPFSRAVIRWDDERKEAVYHVVEPDLDEKEAGVLAKIKDIVQEEIESDFYTLSELGKARSYFDEKIEEILDELRISTDKAQREKFAYYLKRDMLGLGKIEPFFHDSAIEDISCDGISVPLYVYHNRHGSLKSSVMYGSSKEVDEAVLRIAQK
ncbi:hypothetical protein FDZ71_15615, partial [bacterium]